jgi:TIR domain-containing protein/double zinc ribbon protein
MARSVFISHSSADEQLAEEMCSRLESNGIGCWIAPRDIPAGVDWADGIVCGIGECHVMVFLLTKATVASQHLVRELHHASENDLNIVPVRVGGVTECNRSIAFYLATQQWTDVSDPPTKAQWATVVAAVRQQVKHVSEGNPFAAGMMVAETAHVEREWVVCVCKCLSLLESALRHIVRDLLDYTSDRGVKRTVHAACKKVGKVGFRGHKIDSILADVPLPQLIPVYRDATVFRELRKKMRSNLQVSSRINWDHIVGTWRQVLDVASMADMKEEDAANMLYWTKVLLYECELIKGSEEDISKPQAPRALSACRICQAKVASDWVFCPHCGENLKLSCEACERALKPAFRICPFCETPVHRIPTGRDGVTTAEDEYRHFCRGAYFDGVLSVRERILLNEKRLDLGLEAGLAETIETECAPKNVVTYQRFLEGVLVDGVITETERRFLDAKAAELEIDEWMTSQIEAVCSAVRDTSKEFPGLGE